MQFVIRHERSPEFLFAPLQWENAQDVFQKAVDKTLTSETVVLMENGIVFTRTTAVLRIMRKLSGIYPVLYSFIIVPRFLRDAVYRVLARHRYALFGRRQECIVPGPELLARFISSERTESIS